VETNRERFLRMAKEARVLAERSQGQWKQDCEFVARLWDAMAADELERDQGTPRRKPRKRARKKARKQHS
jgi:hypothetical protein